ncbi:hypothetical protein ACFO9Q_16525 [Paenibacillus sp. GCM10023252]|uniref:hypothetical protein n=1 Tax=Paenibacillus sp. GCM10023252 TaxID=3252649 RepID=UPI00360A762D
MNYSSQQGYQGQGFQNQGNQFQPMGYVQSHYQGQLSQPSFGQQQPVIAHTGGYQANNQSYGQQPSTFSHYTAQPISHFSNQGQGQSYSQPVISHLGYTADQQASGPVYQATGYGSHNGSYGGGQPQGYIQGGYVQSHTQQSPVYHATNSYQQAGPVISHLGYQANNNRQGF